MKRKLSPATKWTLLVIALCLVCFIVVPAIVTPATETDPHAGHNHAAGEEHTTPSTTNPAQNKKAKDSYAFVKNKDGSYSYNVLARNGGYILQENNVTRPADFDAISDDVLKVSGQAGTGLAARWAIFCNVQTARKSQIFTYVLGAGKTQVAYVDFLTNKYHVFVCNQFDTGVDRDVYTLEDIKTVTGQEPDITCEQKGNTLKVTYPTEDGKKTITIKLK